MATGQRRRFLGRARRTASRPDPPASQGDDRAHGQPHAGHALVTPILPVPRSGRLPVTVTDTRGTGRGHRTPSGSRAGISRGPRPSLGDGRASAGRTLSARTTARGVRPTTDRNSISETRCGVHQRPMGCPCPLIRSPGGSPRGAPGVPHRLRRARRRRATLPNHARRPDPVCGVRAAGSGNPVRVGPRRTARGPASTTSCSANGHESSTSGAAPETYRPSAIASS